MHRTGYLALANLLIYRLIQCFAMFGKSLREATRVKRWWEMLVAHHSEIYQTLTEVDTILAENSQPLVGHLSGDSCRIITQ